MLLAMTSENIKAARTMTQQPRENLAKEARIPLSTWSKCEAFGAQVPKVSVATLMALEGLFLQYGLAFMPGGVVRLPPTPTTGGAPAVAA
jgi:hypothetical protein